LKPVADVGGDKSLGTVTAAKLAFVDDQGRNLLNFLRKTYDENYVRGAHRDYGAWTAFLPLR
jgi:hypothetical protein